MASYKLVIHEKALDELGISIDYYNHKVSGLGFEFEEDVFALFEVIRKNPTLFPVKFEKIHEAVLKRFPFVINSEVLAKEIIILSVFHSKRHPSKKGKAGK